MVFLFGVNICSILTCSKKYSKLVISQILLYFFSLLKLFPSNFVSCIWLVRSCLGLGPSQVICSGCGGLWSMPVWAQIIFIWWVYIEILVLLGVDIAKIAKMVQLFIRLQPNRVALHPLKIAFFTLKIS